MEGMETTGGVRSAKAEAEDETNPNENKHKVDQPRCSKTHQTLAENTPSSKKEKTNRAARGERKVDHAPSPAYQAPRNITNHPPRQMMKKNTMGPKEKGA